jgi:hypothetical protein
LLFAIDTAWDVIDLYNDASDCLGDSDSMACYMAAAGVAFVAMGALEGPSNNVARRAAKAADVGDAAGDVARRVDDVVPPNRALVPYDPEFAARQQAGQIHERLEELAGQATRNVDARGRSAFSRDQLRDIRRKPTQWFAHRGGLIHDELAELASRDFSLRGMGVKITYRGQPGPDFLWQGHWFDLTTQKSWSGHVSRYADYGVPHHIRYPSRAWIPPAWIWGN